MMNAWKKFNRKIASFAGVLLAFIMLIVVADVLSRLFFNHSIIGVVDIVTILMPVLVFLPLAYTEQFDGHIRVEILTGSSSRQLALLFEAFASLCGVVLLGILVWQGYKGMIESWYSKTYHPGILRIPLYPSLFTIIFGFFLWGIQLLIAGINSIRDFIRNL